MIVCRLELNFYSKSNNFFFCFVLYENTILQIMNQFVNITPFSKLDREISYEFSTEIFVIANVRIMNDFQGRLPSFIVEGICLLTPERNCLDSDSTFPLLVYHRSILSAVGSAPARTLTK